MTEPYKQRIAELLKESKKHKRKQSYAAHTHRILEILRSEKFIGGYGAVDNYVNRERRKAEYKEKYIPLEFDPG